MKIQPIYSFLLSCCWLVLAACGAPDAYENEVDGGVEYGENTQAIGYGKQDTTAGKKADTSAIKSAEWSRSNNPTDYVKPDSTRRQ